MEQGTCRRKPAFYLVYTKKDKQWEVALAGSNTLLPLQPPPTIDIINAHTLSLSIQAMGTRGLFFYTYKSLFFSTD